MRQAIMEGLKVEFARPLLPSAAMSMYTNYPFNQFANPMGMNMRPAGMHRGSGMPPDMQRGPGMHRGGPGMRPGVPAGMGQQPKSPGRGRGILGKYQNKGAVFTLIHLVCFFCFLFYFLFVCSLSLSFLIVDKFLAHLAQYYMSDIVITPSIVFWYPHIAILFS